MFLGNDPVTEANMINALDSLTAGKRYHCLLPRG